MKEDLDTLSGGEDGRDARVVVGDVGGGLGSGRGGCGKGGGLVGAVDHCG